MAPATLTLTDAAKDIERIKENVREELKILVEVHQAGDHRRYGYTKGAAELRIARLKGQIMGMESALTVLYEGLS